VKDTGTARRTGTLPPVVRDLVRHAADSLGVSIEIWDASGRGSERLHLGPGCAGCETEEPRVFDRCRKRRTYLARRDAQPVEAIAEKCPLKLRLARLGRPEAGGPSFFAFGYRGDGDEAGQDERVLSFLRDLRRLVVESASRQIEMSQISDELASRCEEIDLLYSVSGRLARFDDLHTTVMHVLGEWRQVVGGRCAFLWLRDRVLLEVSLDDSVRAPTAEARPAWEAFARRLLDTLDHDGHDSHVEHIALPHPIARALGGALDCIAVPLVRDGRARGVVCGLRPAVSADFAPSEIRLLRSLGAQLGLAVANSDLYEDLKQFLTHTVKALVAAIDAKDSYTAGHSERVNIVSMLIGSEMNLELDELEDLYWSSLLHDVGKIGMPEAILNKPAALDDTEVEIMQQHPERGWQMLHAIERLRGAAAGVRDHHERWDGAGYPRGLRGEAIPIIARIIAVADTFDALVSNRSYRKGRSAAKALDVIAAEAGAQFDPAVTAALGRLLPLLDKHQWVLMSGHRVPTR
jgi:hypothetical protein